MGAFKLSIDRRAVYDIEDATEYYDRQQHGLGARFEKELIEILQILENTPHFDNRYANVRCVPLRKFPFMIHFTIDEVKAEVIIRAVFHTSLDPKKWKERD